MSRMRLKKGDRVRVISGKDKGKEGKILVSIPKENKVIVEGVSVASRHTKPTQANPQGGIVKKETPIYACKVMLICPTPASPPALVMLSWKMAARSVWLKSPAKLSTSIRSSREAEHDHSSSCA